MKWQGRTRGGDFGQRSIFFLLKWVNIRICYLFLVFIIPVTMIVSRANAIAVCRYFRRRHGYGRFKAWLKTYRNHYLFGQLLFDKFAVFAGKKDIFSITFEGQEHFNKAVASKKSCLIAGSHVGNFEMLGYLLSQNTKPINVVIFGGEAEVIQEFRDEAMTNNEMRIVPVTDAISHIIALNNALSAGEFISMPCDRVYTGSKTVDREFMGAKCTFPTGAFHLAEKFDSNVIAIFVMKNSALNYKVYIRPIESDVEGKKAKIDDLQQKYMEELEQIVWKYPEQWYNFYDFWTEDDKKK